MLHVSCWLWGDKYGDDHVDRLAAGVARHLRQPYQWRVFSPQSEDIPLTKIVGCFARLRMFDPRWQAHQRMVPGDRLVTLDLDSVVTGPLDPLFDREEPFLILQGANASNPCPFNGSLQMVEAGYRPDVWTDFSLEAARTIEYHEFPDDQGWLWHKLPNAAGWTAGSTSGVYAFRKPGWPKGGDHVLPKDARLVVFPGWRDPSLFTKLPWVRDNWTT